jgi:hypothetical protein
MAWTDSRLFRAFVADVLDNTAAFDLGSDVPKVALYNNTITPDNDVTAANSAYNVGQWATAQETFEAGQWAAGGVALASTSLNSGTADIVFYDANDTASGSTADITNATGDLVYDDTLTTPVADQGICYNYFGGPNSVVNGTFTVVWNVLGIFRVTL